MAIEVIWGLETYRAGFGVNTGCLSDQAWGRARGRPNMQTFVLPQPGTDHRSLSVPTVMVMHKVSPSDGGRHEIA